MQITNINNNIQGMQKQAPSFIIKYMECSEPSHQPEKLNLICLNKKCQDRSLICSLCCLDKHKGHEFKPLKIHLDQLFNRYHSNGPAYEQELAQLEKRREKLLMHLKQCVESISEEICKLQAAIQWTYERIKEQLQQNEWKRSRFAEFYLTMVNDHFGDPNFQLKNYLFSEHVPLLTDSNIFEVLSKAFLDSSSSVAASITDFSPSSATHAQLPGLFLLPPNIGQEGDVFWQTNFTINAPQLCLLDEDINQWSFRSMRVVVSAFGPFSYLAFGTIKYQEFLKANFQFKDTLSSQYFSSDGKGKGVVANFFTSVGVDTALDFSAKKGKLKVGVKENSTNFNVGENCYLFFVIEGNTKIKITRK